METPCDKDDRVCAGPPLPGVTGVRRAWPLGLPPVLGAQDSQTTTRHHQVLALTESSIFLIGNLVLIYYLVHIALIWAGYGISFIHANCSFYSYTGTKGCISEIPL